MSFSDGDPALADVTNKVNGLVVNEDAKQRVKEANWAEPQKFDYDTYNANPKDKVPVEAGEDDNVPLWAANASKYEWSDEYGDVAPRDERLERMLFGDEHQVREGDQFSK